MDSRKSSSSTYSSAGWSSPDWFNVLAASKPIPTPDREPLPARTGHGGPRFIPTDWGFERIECAELREDDCPQSHVDRCRRCPGGAHLRGRRPGRGLFLLIPQGPSV